MTDAEALFAAIRANPKDAAPWLIAADYFEENGDENTGRMLRTRRERNRLRYAAFANAALRPMALAINTEATLPDGRPLHSVVVPAGRHISLAYPWAAYAGEIPIPLYITLHDVHPGPNTMVYNIEPAYTLPVGGPWGWVTGMVVINAMNGSVLRTQCILPR